MNFLNTVIKILHILICGSIVTLMIKEITDTRQSKKVHELLEDTLSDLTFQSFSLIMMEDMLEDMKEDIYDGLMASYQEELLEAVKISIDNLEKTRKRLKEYLE